MLTHLVCHHTLTYQFTAVVAQVGSMLFDSQMFAHVSLSHAFVDEDDVLYRLQADAEPLLLNSWRVWGDRVEPDPLAILSRCRKQLNSIISRYTNLTTGFVAYDAVAADPAFLAFDEAVCELQAVQLPSMPPDARLAFVLNLYNLCILHAFTKLGRPESTLSRMSFFNNVAYTVGGLVYSFSEVSLLYLTVTHYANPTHTN